MALTGAMLPSAKVDHAYNESLRPYLHVTGDPAYDINSARWSVVEGELPAGLSLDAVTGVVAGTPTAATTAPASFTVQVTYKTKDGQSVYSFDVAANIVVTLAGSTLPKATVNTAYSTSLQSYLSSAGDAEFDAAATRWSLAEGTLPAGLSLDATTGEVAGTPTVKTSSPVSFTVLATYKGSDGQAVYTIEVGGVVLQASKISSGYSHTCAVTTLGAAKCWGYNYFGQLGDGSTINRNAPVSVSGLTSGVVHISVGELHTCAVTTSGAAKCWGYNRDGQLGDNSTNDRAMPVAVSGLTSGVASISASNSHTCAVTTAEGVKCWGSNYSGKLGDNSTTTRTAPVNVVGLTSGVASVHTGLNHTCAVKKSGAVMCWGLNSAGQLGDTTATNRWTPVIVSGLTSGVASIAVGYGHSCAVTTAGTVKCWGVNSYGQLGDGSTTNRLSPVSVLGLASVIATVSGGQSHTCAVTTSGGLKCWGYNANGQLGDNSSVNRGVPGDVVGFGSGAVAVAAGAQHTCAVTTDGTAKCWGWNNAGQLGDNSTANRSSPVDVERGQ